MEFDFDAVYAVEGYGGIAWRADSYAKEWTEESYVFFGSEEDDPADPNLYDWIEPEEIEDRTRVLCHMVGDDRTFTFDVDELTKISEDDYCPECGQIGCTALKGV